MLRKPGLSSTQAMGERGQEVSARHPGAQWGPPPAIQAGIAILLFPFYLLLGLILMMSRNSTPRKLLGYGRYFLMGRNDKNQGV